MDIGSGPFEVNPVVVAGVLYLMLLWETRLWRQLHLLCHMAVVTYMHSGTWTMLQHYVYKDQHAPTAALSFLAML
jgi:hypothetical protein